MNRTQHLSVDAGNVVAVLLADGWHKVAPGSFMVGPMAFGDGGMVGYSFEELDDASPYGPAALAGPLQAVLAIREARPRAMRRSERYHERLRAIDGLRTLASR